MTVAAGEAFALDGVDDLGLLARELIAQLAMVRKELALVRAERDEQRSMLIDMVCAHEEALHALGWNPAPREWKSTTKVLM